MLTFETKPYFTRIALVGVAMYFVVLAITFVATIVFVPSQWAYAPIVAGIVAVFGAAIYLIHPWGLFVGVIGGLIGLAFSLGSFTEDISSPASVFDFAYRPVVALAAAILVLGGCAAGLVQHFRGRDSAAGPPVVSSAVRALVGVAAVIFGVSAILTVVNIHSVSAADKAGATIVTAKAWKYDTGLVTAAADGSTRMVIRNNDLVVHTFTVDELDLHVKVGPRSEELIELTSPRPGTYVFYCTIDGHDEMRGILKVE